MECSEISLPGGVIVLRPKGRIDLSKADVFRDTLLKTVSIAGKAKGAVIVDFADLDYISSAGLRSLMIAAKSAKTEGTTIGIAAMQPVVREIFAISRFDLVFSCFGTVGEAREKLAPPSVESLS